MKEFSPFRKAEWAVGHYIVEQIKMHAFSDGIHQVDNITITYRIVGDNLIC